MITIQRETDTSLETDRQGDGMKMKEILNNMTKDQYRFPYLRSCMVVLSAFELFDMGISGSHSSDLNAMLQRVCNYIHSIFVESLANVFFSSIF